MKVLRNSDATTVLFGRQFGFTLWHQGAISLLAPIGDGVPVQIVFGDWWKAHPEAKREHQRMVRERRTRPERSACV